jgi:acyl-CoA thioester hydrolase
MEFISEVEVRYSETDRMGIVYHSNYFAWFDIARCRLLEEIGYPYTSIEDAGYLCPVINAEISYGTPFKFGETATVYTRISKTTPVRTTYSYRIFLKGDNPETDKPRIEGSTTHCVVSADSFKPCSIKKAIPGLYDKYKEIEQAEV